MEAAAVVVHIYCSMGMQLAMSLMFCSNNGHV